MSTFSRFRKNGITSLKESVDYESQRLRRIKRKNELRRRQQQQQQEGALAPAADNVNSPMSIKSEDLSNGGSPMPGLGAGIGSAATMSPAAAKEEKVSNILCGRRTPTGYFMVDFPPS